MPGPEWQWLLSALRPPAQETKTEGDRDMDHSDGVLGTLLGELDGLDGESLGAVLGAVQAVAARKHHHWRHGNGHHHAGSMDLHRPDWRGRELGPGINAPGEGQVPMPLIAINQTGPAGTGVWSATAVGLVTFQGQLQKPFKGERLVATSQRIGASATALLLGQMFVGVDLNQATIQSFDVEAYGAPTSFDMGMSLMQAPPGVIFSMLVTLGGAPPTNADTITLALSIKGRIIH
jgi:hypothetical protein